MRVKRGIVAHKKREARLKATKGFRWGRKSKERLAKEALLHAGRHAFAGRKQKKRDYRTLWNVKLNAGLREEGLKYSAFIAKLKKENIKLDRKTLSNLAENHPKIWRLFLENVK